MTFDLCRLWTQSGEPGVGGGVQDHQPLLQQYRSLLQHLRRLQVQQQQQQQQQLEVVVVVVVVAVVLALTTATTRAATTTITSKETSATATI